MTAPIGTTHPIPHMNGTPWVGCIELDTDMAGVQAWIDMGRELGLGEVEYTNSDVILDLGNVCITIAPLRNDELDAGGSQ